MRPVDAPLTMSVDQTGAIRIGWGEPDWLGPMRFSAAAGQPAPFTGEDRLGAFDGHRFEADGVNGSARAYRDRPVAVLRIEATRPLSGRATGTFVRPGVAWTMSPLERLDDGVADGTGAFGFQYTEFAMPTFADASLQGWFLY